MQHLVSMVECCPKARFRTSKCSEDLDLFEKSQVPSCIRDEYVSRFELLKNEMLVKAFSIPLSLKAGQ